MNKLAPFAFIIISGMALSGCVNHRDRISSDTITVSIEPAGFQTIAPGGQIQLRAICRSAKSENDDISPTWMVENNLGTFSPATGKTTVFTANNTIGGGKIVAVYGNIRSNEVVASIDSNPQSSLILLADGGFDTGLDRNLLDSSKLNFHYFDTNDSSPWQIATTEVSPGCPSDSAKATMVEYSDSVSGWGGFYLEYSSAKNISTYSNLTFWIKGTTGNEKLKIGMVDGNANETDINLVSYISISSSWQKVTIPLNAFTGVNMGSILRPFIIAFSNAYTADNARVYIDFLRFEP